MSIDPFHLLMSRILLQETAALPAAFFIELLLEQFIGHQQPQMNVIRVFITQLLQFTDQPLVFKINAVGQSQSLPIRMGFRQSQHFIDIRTGFLA